MTAHGDVTMAVRAMQDGAVDFLVKPIRAAVLLERVRQALVLDEQRRQAEAEARGIRLRYARLTPREHEVMEHVVSDRIGPLFLARYAVSSGQESLRDPVIENRTR